MNLKKLILAKICIIIMMLAVFSCKKENPEKFDYPAASYKVYKTKGDYFLYANTWTASNNGPTALDAASTGIIITDGDTLYTRRWKLKENYILGSEITHFDYFTDVTFKEIVAYNMTHEESFPNDLLYKQVVDNDPFIEFYYLDDEYFDEINQYRIDSLNKIIEQNQLQEIFVKVK